MTRRVIGSIVSALLLLVGSAASVDAQQFTGGVRGAVRDANGVIPGVTVTLTNEATNISREVVTNEVGQYNFPAVPPGTYSLKSRLTGYKGFESKGLVIGTQQFITLDIMLDVGALEENITVTGQSPLIDTSDAEMGRPGGGVFNVTAKSGSNNYHGTGFYQTRPVWGQSENYFNAKAGLSKQETGLADAYYRLWGGGVGGPIVKNRTFFWVASEDYQSGTTRNLAEIWPSLNQRNGDFSKSTIDGRPVVLYNPWCRGGAASARCPATGTGSLATGGLFTNAIIPLSHPAVSQVGLNIMKLWPTESIRGPMAANEDNQPNANGTGFLDDRAQMYTFKVEHKFTDKVSLSGFYLYNKTDEPGTRLVKDDKIFMADQDQWFGPLRRRPHVLVFNNTIILNYTP